MPSVSKRQTVSPLVALTALTEPSHVATITRSPASAGAASIGLPSSRVHTIPPLARSMAVSVPALLPK